MKVTKNFWFHYGYVAIYHIIFILIFLNSPIAWATGVLPSDLKALIDKVKLAARHQDYTFLHRIMSDDFIWSFGSDGSSEQAIVEWKKTKTQLMQLKKLSTADCGFIDKENVQCPVKTTLGYRAGFKIIHNQWKMTYFVAGD